MLTTMAIQNNGPYTTKQNISVTGSYMTFGKSSITVSKQEDLFTLCAIMRSYKDFDSYIAGSHPISEFKVDVSTTDPTDDFYTLLYNKVKETFTYTTDV
jgi:hypothetical protein